MERFSSKILRSTCDDGQKTVFSLKLLFTEICISTNLKCYLGVSNHQYKSKKHIPTVERSWKCSIIAFRVKEYIRVVVQNKKYSSTNVDNYLFSARCF